MQTIKIKSKLTLHSFTGINQLIRPLRIQTELHFNEFKCSWLVICDCWISIHSLCFCVSRSTACDGNIMTDSSEKYKILLIVSWLLHVNFRVHMLSESAVKGFTCIGTWVQLLWYSPCRTVCLLFIWSKGIKHGHLWGRLERRYMRRMYP